MMKTWPQSTPDFVNIFGVGHKAICPICHVSLKFNIKYRGKYCGSHDILDYMLKLLPIWKTNPNSFLLLRGILNYCIEINV